MPQQIDITIVKGDTARWSAFIYNATTGSTFNFINCDVYMQVRNGFYPQNLVANYSVAGLTYSHLEQPEGLTGGISVARGGSMYMCIGSSFSNQLSSSRTCEYDVKVHNKSTNDYSTVLKGNIKVLPKITDT